MSVLILIIVIRLWRYIILFTHSIKDRMQITPVSRFKWL
jgi:hypothetical protein